MEARAAAAAARARGTPLLLVSAPGAGSHAGGGWWRKLCDALTAEFPDLAITAVLDCGDAPGAVLAALRAGVTDILFDGDAAVAARLAAIAERHGARLRRVRPDAAAPPGLPIWNQTPREQ
jgi:fructose/tagatose bisphosphate aldolase